MLASFYKSLERIRNGSSGASAATGASDAVSGKDEASFEIVNKIYMNVRSC